MDQWQRELDRHASEVAEAQRDRFRTFEPRIAPAPKPIDDQILEHIVEVATEQDQLLRMQRFLAGIWGSRAENDVNADQRLTRGERYGKAWTAMTIQERFRIAERVAQDWEEFR